MTDSEPKLDELRAMLAGNLLTGEQHVPITELEVAAVKALPSLLDRLERMDGALRFCGGLGCTCARCRRINEVLGEPCACIALCASEGDDDCACDDEEAGEPCHACKRCDGSGRLPLAPPAAKPMPPYMDAWKDGGDDATEAPPAAEEEVEL